MRIFLQYFLWLLSLITLVLFYFLNTYAGHQNLGYLVEGYLSEKTYNKIEVDSLNLEKYPYIVMQLRLNDRTDVTLKGEVDKYKIDMYYHLVGDSFKFNNLYLEDKIDVEGDLSGAFSALHVRGNGELFDGEVNYDFIKIPKKIKDMKIDMHQVDSVKLANFLKQPHYVSGLVDVDAKFQYFSQYEKLGEAKIHMNKALISKFDREKRFLLIGSIEFEDRQYRYLGDISSEIGSVIISNGAYHKSKKTTEADYHLSLKDLAYFEKYLKHKYRGSLDTKGRIFYDNGLEVKGVTNKFGGELKYVYKEENLDLKLNALSLEKLLEQFSYPLLFSSKVYGNINYNLKEKIVLINTDLKETRFRRTHLSDILYNKAGIDILSTVYDKSSFSGGYQNSLLSSILKIDNGREHIYLTDTKMNALKNTINSKFEIKIDGQEIYGDIYGTLKEPQVSVDMKKLLKYQMNKQLSGWFGTNKKETIKKELKNVKRDVEEKIKNIDIDEVTESAKSLMDSFF